jgi:hypothetical protein
VAVAAAHATIGADLGTLAIGLGVSLFARIVASRWASCPVPRASAAERGRTRETALLSIRCCAPRS